MARDSFFQGARQTAPLLLGIFPFAVIAGATAVREFGSWFPAVGFSLVAFAGAAQLAALDLLANQAPLWMIILTAWIVNLRFVIYSATLAPHYRGFSSGHKKTFAYLLTDQAFALTLHRLDGPVTEMVKKWFYLGAALTLWATWQGGTVVGALLGNRVPASWSLDFAVPLSFIALLVPAIKDGGTVVAGLAAGVTVLLTASWPFNLGFVFAVAIGVTVGVAASRWWP